MKQTINFYDFERAFKAIRPDNFSYEGLRVLFEYFEEYEDSTDEEVELDVIAICCDFTESDPDEIIADYGLESEFRLARKANSPLLSAWRIYGDREMDVLVEYLNERTMVAGQTDTTIIYGAF